MPYIVGPYTAEIAFEIQCWIPFLKTRLGDNLDNCVAISRGANEFWYPCPVVNAYDIVSPSVFREMLDKRYKLTGTTKPTYGDELDRLILDRLNIKYVNFHPLNIFNGGGLKTYGELDSWHPYCQKFKPVERYPHLPDRYIAARFYKSAWFYESPQIKEDLPVVGLCLKEQPDNHPELEHDCDYVIDYEPRASFHVLSRVIANAEKTICNYGSMVDLSIAYGVPVEAYTHYPSDAKKAWNYNTQCHLAEKFGGSLKIIPQAPTVDKPFVAGHYW